MGIDSKDVLLKLQAEPAPLSWAKLKKAFVNKKLGVSEADLRSALSGEGIHAWPKTSFWHVDPAAQLNAGILAQCAKKALKKTEIKVKGRGPKDISAAIDHLINERKLLKYPALAGTSVLLVAEGSPEAYWEYVREVVAAKLKKAGIEESGLYKGGLEDNIFDILPTLEPAMNVPISVDRVRRALGQIDKKRFDEAALTLRQQGRVYLSQHDHPLGLNEEDRNVLIEGKDGRYYVAISRLGE